jgi:polyvinyl alcohol dehydrogenase (cytochrome)
VRTYLRISLFLAGSHALAGCAESAHDASTNDGVSSRSQALSYSGVSEDPAQASADWPSAGHDWSHSGHNGAERTIGTANVQDLVPVWQHRFEVVPGEGVPVIATAVAAEGVAYIVDVAGYAHARNLADGTLLWSQPVSDAPPEPMFRSVIQGGPVVSDDGLYVGDVSATVFKLDRSTGQTVWSKDVDAHPAALIQGDLATAGPYVLFGVSSFESDFTGDLTMRGSVVALDRSDGSLGWQLFTTSDQSVAHPRYGAGVGVWSSPAIDFWRNRVYIGTGQFYEPGNKPNDCKGQRDLDLSDSLLSISLCDGRLDHARQFTSGDVYSKAYPNGKDYDVGTPPNLFDVKRGRSTISAVGVGDKEGTYHVMDRRTLRPLWSKRVAQGSTLGGFQATAAYANGVIYVAAHERSDGTSLQTALAQGQSLDLSSQEGLLLIQKGARTNVMALHAATGATLWQRTTPGAITLAPLVLANGVLYQGDANGALRAYAAATGELLFSVQLGGFTTDDGFLAGNVITGLSISRGRLLVSSLPLSGDAPTGVTAFGLPSLTFQ